MRDGKMIAALSRLPNVNPALSPDRKQLAVTTGRETQAGIWLVDLERGASTRIIPDGSWPTWSPDGSSLAFSANRVGGIADIFVRPTTGRGDDRLLLRTNESKVVNDWSRDGRYIVYASTNAQMKQDLWLLPLFGDQKPVPYLQTPFSQIQAQVSPDGRWLTYASDESGSWEVYLQSFPVPGSKRTISVGGGGEPRWRADGRELFYIRADKTLMSVSIDAGDPGKGVGLPRPLFNVPVVGDTSQYRSRYAVLDNGDQFLFNALDERNQMPITVLVNWTSLLPR
jgi:Tol biopolymer transport system component